MVKQISDNEIYLLIKYIKSVLWRVAKCLSYIEEARCLKVKPVTIKKCSSIFPTWRHFKTHYEILITSFPYSNWSMILLCPLTLPSHFSILHPQFILPFYITIIIIFLHTEYSMFNMKQNVN